jgi:hypothetical protein
MLGDLNTVDADRSCNVLDGLLAHILKIEGKLVAHLIVHDARNHDPAGIGEGFEPRRDVDAVAKNIITVKDNVADIDADAEFDTPVRRHLDVALDHTSLNIDGAAHGVDDADEFHQHAVSGRLDDMTAVLCDLGIDQFLAMRLELAQGAFIVNAHQPTVPGDITCKYCGKPAVDAFFDHIDRPHAAGSG